MSPTRGMVTCHGSMSPVSPTWWTWAPIAPSHWAGTGHGSMSSMSPSPPGDCETSRPDVSGVPSVPNLKDRDTLWLTVPNVPSTPSSPDIPSVPNILDVPNVPNVPHPRHRDTSQRDVTEPEGPRLLATQRPPRHRCDLRDQDPARLDVPKCPRRMRTPPERTETCHSPTSPTSPRSLPQLEGLRHVVA